MLEIDDKFVDVDFQDDPNFVFGDLGPQCFGASLPSYGDAVPTLTDSEIRAAIDQMDADGGGAERLVTRIYNQGQEGACVANATCQANEIIQALQFGKENVVHLSAMSLYKRIGRSASSGAMVSDGLEELAKRGALPLDTPENRAKYGGAVMPNTGWRTPMPDNWQETAKQLRATEWFVVDTTGELLTALCNQHPVVVGRAGHSICYTRPLWRNGEYQSLYANSWGEWGLGAGDFTAGFGVDSFRMIRSSANWAFALRQVVDR